MRKYYDEEDEDEGQDLRKVDQPTFLPEVYLKGVDWLIALVLGGCVVVSLTLFSFPGLCPDVWGDAAVAAGLRPPSALFPGFWRVLARVCYLGGVAQGEQGLLWGGRLVAGLTTGGVYLLVRNVLALLVRGRLRYAVRRMFVQRVAAALGALFFACSDPVWRAGQSFAPSGLLVFLTVLQFALFVGFLLNGRRLSGLLSMFLVGLIAAESPFGFLQLALCWTAFSLALRRGALCQSLPLFDPVLGWAFKWHLTVAWALGLIAGIAANCGSFIAMDGLTAAGMTGGDIPLQYLLCWWHRLLSAASGMGWVLGCGVALLPVVVAGMMLPRAVDEEQFLPYHVGAVFFFTGALAFAQLAMLAPLWFWSWTDAVEMRSAYFWQLLMLCSSLTVVFALVVLGTDACCRNTVRLAMQRYADIREEESDRNAAPTVHKRGKRGGLVIFFVIAVLLAAAVFPGRGLTRTRQMLAIINDYVREVVNECAGIHWIFTDGSFDARLELVAAAQGHPLKALSMMSANSPYEQYLRKRGVTDAEDLMSLSMGAPMTLRSWMRDKPARMADAAIQLGFELWKQRAGSELPPCSGVLARPQGMSNADCARGVAAATALADRILEIYTTGGLEKEAGRTIKELFLFVQWRIARLARMRAERADRAGDTKTAMKDVAISDKLDNTNESLQRILDAMEKARATTLKQVSPREGLQLALARADFALARRYGETILAADPDDPDANFGVGMSYYTQNQFARAEEYLKHCLVKRPKEPAVWNNLAMICIYTKRFDEAEKHAKKALELIPNSAEVKDTIKKIGEARAAARAEAVKKGDKK